MSRLARQNCFLLGLRSIGRALAHTCRAEGIAGQLASIKRQIVRPAYALDDGLAIGANGNGQYIDIAACHIKLLLSSTVDLYNHGRPLARRT